MKMLTFSRSDISFFTRHYNGVQEIKIKDLSVSLIDKALEKIGLIAESI